MNYSNCNGGPNLSLNLHGQAVPVAAAPPSSESRRPKSTPHAKAHRVVHKDYYRLMKSEKNVDRHLSKKKSKEFGRAAARSALDVKKAKFKSVGEVISEQYTRAAIPDSRLYMIDKVVRMRGQHGRFGIDHSELLNYELEQTNKPRDEHMNWMVAGYTDGNSVKNRPNETTVAAMSDGAKVSEVLFNRLSVKDEERYSDYSQRSILQMGDAASQGTLASLKKNGGSGLSYSDWLKAKDAEKRLRRKLTVQAQSEIKEELLHVAKQEREKYESRIHKMDDWLMSKKLEEAEKIAHLRELDRREE